MAIKRIKLDSTLSTNSYLLELLKQGNARKEIIVLADYQESGRGQGTHSWHSERGKNLLMSLLLFPAFLSASKQFHLSRMASQAICDILVLEDLICIKVNRRIPFGQHLRIWVIH
jgi:BirA family biotin operon repressor/biotin-[acetyl-CoA-carboxylase] ligase